MTMGGEGSVIHARRRYLCTLPVAKPEALVDPTGCGDAYRAGLLYGIAHRWDWEKTGGLAAVLGALKIASRGGQNHVVNRDVVDASFKRTFGTHLW